MEEGKEGLRLEEDRFGIFPFKAEWLFGLEVKDGMEVYDHMREKPAGWVAEGFFRAFLTEEEEVGHFEGRELLANCRDVGGGTERLGSGELFSASAGGIGVGVTETENPYDNSQKDTHNECGEESVVNVHV